MRYCRQISTGKFIETQSGGDENNPHHLQTLRDNTASNSIPQVDLEFGYCTDEKLAEWILALRTPLEDWKEEMAGTDNGMPRYIEDLITDKFDGNAGLNLQVRYDEKVALRATKP